MNVTYFLANMDISDNLAYNEDDVRLMGSDLNTLRKPTPIGIPFNNVFVYETGRNIVGEEIGFFPAGDHHRAPGTSNKLLDVYRSHLRFVDGINVNFFEMLSQIGQTWPYIKIGNQLLSGNQRCEIELYNTGYQELFRRKDVHLTVVPPLTEQMSGLFFNNDGHMTPPLMTVNADSFERHFRQMVNVFSTLLKMNILDNTTSKIWQNCYQTFKPILSVNPLLLHLFQTIMNGKLTCNGPDQPKGQGIMVQMEFFTDVRLAGMRALVDFVYTYWRKHIGIFGGRDGVGSDSNRYGLAPPDSEIKDLLSKAKGVVKVYDDIIKIEDLKDESKFAAKAKSYLQLYEDVQAITEDFRYFTAPRIVRISGSQSEIIPNNGKQQAIFNAILLSSNAPNQN